MKIGEKYAVFGGRHRCKIFITPVWPTWHKMIYARLVVEATENVARKLFFLAAIAAEIRASLLQHPVMSAPRRHAMLSKTGAN